MLYTSSIGVLIEVMVVGGTSRSTSRMPLCIWVLFLDYECRVENGDHNHTLRGMG